MSTLTITHSSTACGLLEIGSIRILTDPVLDAGEQTYAFAPTIHETRQLGPALSHAEILRAPLDAVLLSHAHHADNLDETGRALLREPAVKRIITSRCGAKHVAERHKTCGLEFWESTVVRGSGGEEITVTATPAQHLPRWLWRTKKVCGFVLEWPGQERGAIYISGDTVLFDGVREVAHRFTIGTAILHLGGGWFWHRAFSFFRVTFDAREAAEAACFLGAKTVIPIHYEPEVWTHFKETAPTCNRAFEEAGVLPKVQWLDRGRPTPIDV